jgi:hypothetical protein
VADIEIGIRDYGLLSHRRAGHGQNGASGCRREKLRFHRFILLMAHPFGG